MISEYAMAKIAYDGYCKRVGGKSAISGSPLPEFDKCPELVQMGWIAAIDAVLDYG